MVKTGGQRGVAFSTAVLVALIGVAVLQGEHVGDSYTTIAIMLGEPVNATVLNYTSIDFGYYPVINNGTFFKCELWTNETGSMALEETNATEIVNATLNNFTHTLSMAGDGSLTRYTWSVKCYINSTDYNESMIAYVATGAPITVEFSTSGSNSPILYDSYLPEINTTHTQTYIQVLNFTDVGLPLWSIRFNLTAYDAYNYAYFRYVLTYEDGSTEENTASVMTSSPPVTTEYNYSFDNYWYDVDNLSLQLKSLDGGNVSIDGVRVFKTGALGCTVGPINQSNSTNLYNVTVPSEGGEWDIWVEVNETFDCITHFFLTNGTYIYDKDEGVGIEPVVVTDFPNKVYVNLTNTTGPLKLWNFVDFFYCDPGNLTTYNWEYHILASIDEGW